MQVDTLIEAGWVLPVEPAGAVLTEHAVAITAGRIVAVLPRAQAAEQLTAGERVALPGHALIPGLVNAHTHSPMTLFRGIADDLPLMTWLQEHIWPAEQRWISEAFVAAGSRLAALEMLRGGVTCFNDMYFYPDITARAAAAAGMRAVVGLIVIDFPSAWATDADGYLQRGLEVHDAWATHPLIRTAFAPHAPYSVSDAPLQRVRTLSDELDIPIHIHVHETRDEIRDGETRHGKRPLQRLDDLGLLSPALLGVHMVHLEDHEIALAAQRGVRVVHCPESNLKLGSGFCRVGDLLDAGVEVALGTDGAASNNDLDLLGELRTAALLAKGLRADSRVLPADQALQMATLSGARALGLDDDIGSLTPGKAADIVAIDLQHPQTQPLYHPVSQVVYAAGREQVTDVWVAGTRVVRDRTCQTLDSGQILAEAAVWQRRIAETAPR